MIVCLPPIAFGNTIPSPSLNIRVSPFTSTVTDALLVERTPTTLTVWKYVPSSPRGLHAPRRQVIRDVTRGKAEAFGEDLPSLELVGRNIAQPFTKVALLNEAGIVGGSSALWRNPKDKQADNQRRSCNESRSHHTHQLIIPDLPANETGAPDQPSDTVQQIASAYQIFLSSHRNYRCPIT